MALGDGSACATRLPPLMKLGGKKLPPLLLTVTPVKGLLSSSVFILFGLGERLLVDLRDSGRSILR